MNKPLYIIHLIPKNNNFLYTIITENELPFENFENNDIPQLGELEILLAYNGIFMCKTIHLCTDEQCDGIIEYMNKLDKTLTRKERI